MNGFVAQRASLFVARWENLSQAPVPVAVFAPVRHPLGEGLDPPRRHGEPL